MLLKTKVIVANIANLHDARYCAGMGVDWLAFPTDAVSPAEFAEIAGWISGPRMAAQTQQPLAEGYAVDAIFTQNAQLLGQTGELPIMLGIDWHKDASFQELESQLGKYADQVAAFVLSSEEKTLDAQTLAQLAQLAAKYTIFLGFGLTPENALEAIAQIKPEGIALKGGNEAGISDFDSFADILETIEQ